MRQPGRGRLPSAAPSSPYDGAWLTVTLHLHGRVGPYGLLLSSAMVLEVWPVGAGENSGAVHLWRGRALPLIDARSLFGLPPRPSGAQATDVAYGRRVDDPAAVVLALDQVAGVADLAAAELHPLPPISALTNLVFDAVTGHREGEGHLLRLRADPDFDAVRRAGSLPAAEAAPVPKAPEPEPPHRQDRGGQASAGG